MGCKKTQESQMKRKNQLSLAQAIGDLSKIEPEKLIGLKVIFERFYNKKAGSRRKKKIQMQGIVIGLQKTPGFVLIQNEKGSLFSRNVSEIWRDIHA